MEEAIGSMNSPQPQKKRKLRRPRTAKACLFCRKRKVRCSGTLPCEYCIREEAICDYGPGYGPAPSTNRQVSETAIHSNNGTINRRPPDLSQSHTTTSNRASLDPPQTFAEGQHVGPISGISFLYHPWDKTEKRDTGNQVVSESETSTVPSAPLVSYGDCPQVVIEAEADDVLKLTADQFDVLLERYFRYATPTYRYLHQPTLNKWARAFATSDGKLTASQRACVLITSAQSLLHAPAATNNLSNTAAELKLSRNCFQTGKELLENEPGPPSLASIQARIAMCLYLLSTFRMNECRYCFSFAITVLTSLGLHRKQSSSIDKFDLVEAESRKRTFWCAYVLDGYLSVMLGRPRLLRDEDIDQPYPLNIDDQDLLSSEKVEELPMHGNLEAFIGHASLAKLMAKNSDLLYPLESLSEDQILQRSYEMLDRLNNWRDNLPEFLKPRTKTLTGSRTFERQNTVLKLAFAHLQILATRRLLLADFNRLGRSGSTHTKDIRAIRPIQECVAAVQSIIDAAYTLKMCGTLYDSFWFTQYAALVAISTLYVFIVQGMRHALPENMNVLLKVDEYFIKAKECQTHLSLQAPEGSQAKRHHHLLDQLRLRVEKDLARRKSANTNHAIQVSGTVEAAPTIDSSTQLRTIVPKESADATLADSSYLPFNMQPQITTTTTFDEITPLASFTPGSDYDESFRNMLGSGWETLDTVGFMGVADTNYQFLM